VVDIPSSQDTTYSESTIKQAWFKVGPMLNIAVTRQMLMLKHPEQLCHLDFSCRRTFRILLRSYHQRNSCLSATPIFCALTSQHHAPAWSTSLPHPVHNPSVSLVTASASLPTIVSLPISSSSNFSSSEEHRIPLASYSLHNSISKVMNNIKCPLLRFHHPIPLTTSIAFIWISITLWTGPRFPDLFRKSHVITYLVFPRKWFSNLQIKSKMQLGQKRRSEKGWNLSYFPHPVKHTATVTLIWISFTVLTNSTCPLLYTFVQI
jgi:hypothetical protein